MGFLHSASSSTPVSTPIHPFQGQDWDHTQWCSSSFLDLHLCLVELKGLYGVMEIESRSTTYKVSALPSPRISSGQSLVGEGLASNHTVMNKTCVLFSNHSRNSPIRPSHQSFPVKYSLSDSPVSPAPSFCQTPPQRPSMVPRLYVTSGSDAGTEGVRVQD